MEICITVNEKILRLSVEANELLINILRDKINLTGTKYGCGIGECGACTVLMNGEPVLACLVLAVEADGQIIDTVEGVANNGVLDPVQEAYLEEGAIQCGFCTPGFIMMSKALLTENSSPSEMEIREYLRGNMCRCTGYVNIVKAVQSAARKIKN